LKADGRIALHQGAVDIGQAEHDRPQICADAMGAPIERLIWFRRYCHHARLRKTSASRQTFVTGKAAAMVDGNCAKPSSNWLTQAKGRAWG